MLKSIIVAKCLRERRSSAIADRTFCQAKSQKGGMVAQARGEPVEGTHMTLMLDKRAYIRWRGIEVSDIITGSVDKVPLSGL